MALAALSPKKMAEAGFEVTLLDPATDLSLNELITVYGSDSSVCRDIQRRQTNHRLELAAKKGGRRKATMSAETLEAEAMDLLVGCTKSWRTLIKDENGKVVDSRPQIELEPGEWLDCTPENVRRVYEALPWAKEQVDQAIGDRSNFLQN